MGSRDIREGVGMLDLFFETGYYYVILASLTLTEVCLSLLSAGIKGGQTTPTKKIFFKAKEKQFISCTPMYK